MRRKDGSQIGESDGVAHTTGTGSETPRVESLPPQGGEGLYRYFTGRGLFPPTGSEPLFAAGPGHRVLQALMLSGGITGGALAIREAAHPNRWWLVYLEIDAIFRGRGWGKALLQAIEKRIRVFRGGFLVARIPPGVSVEEASRFLIRNGFQKSALLGATLAGDRPDRARHLRALGNPSADLFWKAL